jgi:hypothetical protein
VRIKGKFELLMKIGHMRKETKASQDRIEPPSDARQAFVLANILPKFSLHEYLWYA